MTNSNPLLDGLDPLQLEAVIAEPTPLVVFAGAGSGKTRVLTTRVAYMIHELGVNPSELFVSAFTKAASEEMSERIVALAPEAMDLVIGTFHSLMFRFLNEERFSANLPRLKVVNEGQRKRAISDMLGKPSRDFPNALNVQCDVANVSGQIGAWKNELVHHYDAEISETADSAPYGSDLQAAAALYPLYEAWLKNQRMLDFDDMLLHAYDLLSTNSGALGRARTRWTAFLIDEAQDTNVAQWGIIRLLADAAEDPNLTIVGDTRQCLYRFRGAVPELMEGFETIYPGARKIDLTMNYRSTPQVIERANRLIGPLNLPDQTPNRPDGPEALVVPFLDPKDQAVEIARLVQAVRDDGRPGGDVAVLIRTNAQSAEVESAMVAARLPYWCRNGGFFSRMEIGDVMAYLRLANTRDDGQALRRIINKPTRYLGAAFVEAVERTAREQDIDLVDAIRCTYSYRNRKLNAKQTSKAMELAALLDAIGPDAEGRSPLPTTAIRKVLEATDYIEWLRETTGTSEGADDSRKENLDALLEVAMQYGTIDALLAFADESEKLQQESDDATQISTVHRAKGREWPVVFVTNFYEESIPHKRAILEGGINDERRIAYVAFTRARDVLVVGVPSLNDKGEAVSPSRFLADAEMDSLGDPDDELLDDNWWGAALAS